MNTQKNIILPPTPSKPEDLIKYNNDLTLKLKEAIREIAVDLENLDKRIKVLETP